MPVAIGGSGSITGLGPFSFLNDAGNASVVRPQFMAYGTWGFYTHNFNGTTPSPALYTTTAGRQSFPAWNNVSGGNTAGFVTSSTPGTSYYDIPITGYYMFTFQNLINNPISNNHIDAGFNITDAATNTFRESFPWGDQYLGQSATTYGNAGFDRLQPTSSGVETSKGITVIGKFYVGQRIRPQIVMGANVGNLTVFCSNHNYFHGVYLGK